MNYYVKILIRKDRVNTDLTHTLYLRFTSGHSVKYFSIHQKVLPQDWNEKSETVKKSDFDYLRKNKLISICKTKALNIIDKFIYENNQLTINDFEKLFKVEVSENNNFFDFIEKEKLTRFKVFKPQTIRMYKSQITKLKDFRTVIYFNDFNLDFVNNYKGFLIAKGNNDNTISKAMTILKRMLNWAVEKNVIKENIFKHIKITKHQGKRNYLTVSEVDKLEKMLQMNVLNSDRTEILKYFLFACYTGLRYYDLKNLKLKNILYEIIDNEKKEYISIQMEKTKEFLTVPIIQQAKELIKKDLKPENKIFKVRCNQVTNRRLKEIMELAEIDKQISFHCARHTFATIGLEKGIPIDTISKLLGHTEIKTTQIYAKITMRKKFLEMEKF